MGLIDWGRGAAEISRMVRALNPWPSAYTYLGGKMLKIWKATADASGPDAASGTVTEVTKDSVTVSCGEGSLILKEVQLEGKKRMSVHDFLLGAGLTAGQVLG